MYDSIHELGRWDDENLPAKVIAKYFRLQENVCIVLTQDFNGTCFVYKSSHSQCIFLKLQRKMKNNKMWTVLVPNVQLQLCLLK